jgi:dCMP deaminase
MRSELFVGYIPVLHDGYLQAFNRHPDATIGVLDDTVLSDVPYLRKDIRRLPPAITVAAIRGIGREALLLGQQQLEEALHSPLIMPDDDVTRKIIERYPNASITTESIFLRWDRDNSMETSGVIPDRTVSFGQNDPIVNALSAEAKKSSNWWRHIGVAFVREGEIQLTARNSSLPTSYTSSIDSDPRITAQKGEAIERSIDIHAEARLIAEASRTGHSLEGGELYVSTFPCPNCAKLIALSGVRSCYFIEGYAMLDGATILQQSDVEIVKIDTDDFESDTPNNLKPYPTS